MMRELPRNFRSAFTLVEMLVVISIIIVMIAVAVPVVKTLTGNNSLAGAENKVAAMLAVARSDAIYNRQITGVVFFIDPATNAFAMAEVMPNQVYPHGVVTTSISGSFTFSGSTPLSPQQTLSTLWTGTSVYGSATQATIPGNAPYLVPCLEMVYTWQPSTASATTPMNKYYYRDVVGLPNGVGVALCNNNAAPSPNANSPMTYAGQPDPSLDRYMRFGAIMFNTDGTLLQMPYGIAEQNEPVISGTPLVHTDEWPANQLGARLQLPGASPVPDVTSQVKDAALLSETGLLFYDRNGYLSQPGFTETDLEYLLPWQAAILQVSPSQSLKQTEEAWLDQNSVSAVISPLNGNLVKSK